ncbi:MAG: hypothetical protein LQ340_003833 [Diploschistes diacapsis]|nr:MAG: hypothetical protein LQ340_003833 [Diploschistes diacapsis]
MPPKATTQVALGSQGGLAEKDAIFKGGFLASVYQERPKGSPGIEKVTTRFPPEPNGFLHLGHSKAITINFGFARYHGGDCYLRFDDTNPGAEEGRFFDAIEEMIAWLGFKPIKVTYSSDNFDKLYELAEQLIQDDGAYVCHCTQEQVKASRGVGEDGKGGGKRAACAHRDRPISESLKEFRAMKDGKYAAGEAVLRMKQDLSDGNPQMWDLAAYRIPKESRPHHRTGRTWKIYPTYDYTHCLCDSFEGITHSLCTTEFELSRQSYEWLCHRVKVYTPMQREFGRLSLEGVVLSKRKLTALVQKGYVHGWDDPRLYTLIALRRRGVPPGAILSFVNDLGVTKANAFIEVTRFEQYLRKYLETTVPRLNVILDPIPVVIENLPDEYLEMVELPFSKDPAFGNHSIPFTKTVYIEHGDFREEDSKDYFRLAPGKAVGLLKVPYPIIATGFEKGSDGRVSKVQATYVEPDADGKFKKPKAYIQWVGHSPSHHSPLKARVRYMHSLFDRKDPDTHPDGWEASVNHSSEEWFNDALIEPGFLEIKRRAPWPEEAGEKGLGEGQAKPETVRFQGQRTAYFCEDKDSAPDNIVLNRIVSLKEDTGKQDDTGKKEGAEKVGDLAKSENKKRKEDKKKKKGIEKKATENKDAEKKDKETEDAEKNNKEEEGTEKTTQDLPLRQKDTEK